MVRDAGRLPRSASGPGHGAGLRGGPRPNRPVPPIGTGRVSPALSGRSMFGPLQGRSGLPVPGPLQGRSGLPACPEPPCSTDRDGVGVTCPRNVPCPARYRGRSGLPAPARCQGSRRFACPGLLLREGAVACLTPNRPVPLTGRAGVTCPRTVPCPARYGAAPAGLPAPGSRGSRGLPAPPATEAGACPPPTCRYGACEPPGTREPPALSAPNHRAAARRAAWTATLPVRTGPPRRRQP